MRGLKKTAPDGADRQTDRQTDMATLRPTWPRGAELVKKKRKKRETLAHLVADVQVFISD